MCVLQGFTLNYRRSEAIRTRTVVRNALIKVIQSGLQKKTDWNVKIVMEEPGQRASSKPSYSRRSNRSKRKVDARS